MAHFTKQEVEEMRQRLAATAVKDTDLPETMHVSMTDYIAIVQDGRNKKTSIGTLYSTVEYQNYTVNIYVYNGSMIMRRGSSADLVAQVLRNETDITDYIPSSLFSWERSSGYSEADRIWNNAHRAAGKTIHITSADVMRECTFFCVVPIDSINDLNL